MENWHLAIKLLLIVTDRLHDFSIFSLWNLIKSHFLCVLALGRGLLIYSYAMVQGIGRNMWPKTYFLISLKNIFPLGFIYEVGVLKIYL